jgi:hypothetical protein
LAFLKRVNKSSIFKWLWSHRVKQGCDRTTIDSDTYGIKIFVTNLMCIEAAEGSPPKRRRAKRAKTARLAPSNFASSAK